MRIAICDDDPKDLETLSAMLYAYGERTGGNLLLFNFSSGDSLLQALESGARFDVLFLDILMPGIGGVEAARELRRMDDVSELVFLTVSPDFALDAFSVKARDYLIKPLTEATLFRLMDGLVIRLGENEQIVIESKSGLKRLTPDRVEYCEVFSHKLCWHLRSGAVLESAGTIGDAERLLSPSGLFLRVHRSFLVNKHRIVAFEKSQHIIELESMTRIPVPKAKFLEIQALYNEKMKGGKTT